MKKNIQFITDANGERIAVILPIEDYENLLEDLHVIRVAEETRNEPTIPLEDLLAELRAEGKIDI